jgi:hypothetical protein
MDSRRIRSPRGAPTPPHGRFGPRQRLTHRRGHVDGPRTQLYHPHPGTWAPIAEGVRALAVHCRFRSFPRVFHAKRLELKTPLGQTKAEELGQRGPSPSAFVWPRGFFRSSRFSAVSRGKRAAKDTVRILKIVRRYSETADHPRCALAARTMLIYVQFNEIVLFTMQHAATRVRRSGRRTLLLGNSIIA